MATAEEDRAALERLHSDATGVPGPGVPGAPPWLNSYEVVNALVRGFAADLLRRYGATATGGMEPDDFVAWLERECRRLNDLFMGVTAAVVGYGVGPWNSPEQIGHHVLLAFRIEGELRFGVRDALMILARDLIQVSNAHDGEPAEAWGWEMDLLIENAVRVFLGFPPDRAGADEDGEPEV